MVRPDRPVGSAAPFVKALRPTGRDMPVRRPPSHRMRDGGEASGAIDQAAMGPVRRWPFTSYRSSIITLSQTRTKSATNRCRPSLPA